MKNATAKFLARSAPWAAAFLYVSGGFLLLARERRRLPGYLAAPAGVYGAVSWLRATLNRPRPFEKDGRPPLLPHSPGRAFPSRHAAMAGVLITSAARVSPRLLGPGLGVLAAVCWSRVACRLHGWADVLSGAALGMAGGSLCFFKPRFPGASRFGDRERRAGKK